MKTYKILLLLLSIALSACEVQRVYTSGSYGDLKSYTAKPEYQGKKEKALYVSAGYTNGSHEQSYRNEAFKDEKTVFSANIHKSITDENYNYFYGGGASFGSYTFTKGLEEVINDGDRENFYNVNTKAGINYTFAGRRWDFRCLGVEAAYHYEFGSYPKKIKEISETYDASETIIVVDETSIFSWNLYSELVYKINQNNTVEFGIFAGAVFLSSEKIANKKSSFIGYSLAYRHKRFTLSLIGSDANAADPIRAMRYGITYRID